MQVYFALSPISAPSITKELLSVKYIRSPSITCTPSLNQVTDGVGTPLTGHLMVMVVFETAVTLSPMFMFTGLPSPTGIFPDTSTSMAGLTGSALENSNVLSGALIKRKLKDKYFH